MDILNVSHTELEDPRWLGLDVAMEQRCVRLLVCLSLLD